MQRLFTHASEIDENTHTIVGHTPLVTKLLINRGITSQEAADSFITPRYENMHDSFLMHDMEKAVDRLFEAVKAHQKIVIYADYDCDGIPGAVIIHDLLTKIEYDNFQIYIPDRHEEGYGLNTEAVEKFITEGVKLLITIDLGTTDHADIALAQKAGIDVIVTDHHLPHATLPEAYAVVNPKITDAYPEKMLCGAGVMFKFVQGFIQKYGAQYTIGTGWEKWLMDMAGLATLSDMVPLTGENRAMASFGMQVLRKSPRPGLMHLFQKLKMQQQHIVADDITFMITPRLNAASRMDSPMRAFELLSEKDVVKAGMLAEHLTKINDERKQLVAQIMKEVKHALSERTLGDVIVIGNPTWRVGILGLVAGKILDEFDRPVFVWGCEGMQDTETMKGSCRSNGTVNIVNLMQEAKDSFIDFGGHELAGGFSLPREQVHFLEEKLCIAYGALKKENSTTGAVIDAILTLADVQDHTYRSLEKLAPFGLANPKPLFLFQNVQVLRMKQFGKEKNHLELTVADDTGIEKTAMSFFADENTFTKSVRAGATVDLIATIEKSFFAGRTTLRLRIVDIQ